MYPALEKSLRSLTSPTLTVSAGLGGLRSRGLRFSFSLHQITELPGLLVALTDSRSTPVDTWSRPRALELPGLGCDGGGAPTAGGSLEPPNVHGNWGKPRAASSLECWEGCNQWVWVGQSASPEHDTSSLIAPQRTRRCSEEAEGQALPLAGQVEQAGHFSLLGTGLHT